MFLIFLAFYFEIILDLQQNCKNSSDGYCTPLRDSEGWGNLVCCSPWGRKELGTT